MTKRSELFAELKALGVATTVKDTNVVLEERLAQAKEKNAPEEEVSEDADEERITSEGTDTEDQELDGVALESVPTDYLRQYQVRKGTVPGSKESDPIPESKSAMMKEELLKQHKVRIIVPRAPKEDPSIMQSVQLNGYRMDFPKQTYIEVPQQVAEVITRSQQQTDDAIAEGQIDYEARKDGVTFGDALL